MIITKTFNKPFNKPLLREELQAREDLDSPGLLSNMSGVTFAGFTPASNDRRRELPNATRQVYRTTFENGQRVTYEADPGEIHFETSSDPGSALDEVLAAHDAIGQDTEEQEEAALIALAQQMNAVYQAGGPTNQEMRQFIRGMWRILRRKIRQQ